MDKENRSQDENQTESEELDEGLEQEEEIRKVGSDTNESIAFYPPPARKKDRKTLYLIIILILIFVGIAIFFRSQIKNMVVGAPKPTPSPISTPIPTPAPTPDPLNKSEWNFEVLNGTTTSGQAKKIADKLIERGYTVVKTGNADKQNYSTTQILVKKELMDKIDLVVADLKDTVKIASVSGELKEGTASARIIIGKDLSL